MPALTRRGWTVAAGAVALAVIGRVLGLFELFVLAAGAAGLLLAGGIAVALRPLDLTATRTVRPNRVHAGANSRVDLTVRNRAARPSPVITVRDAFSPAQAQGGESARRQARLLLAPLAAGRDDRATYRLPAEHRGIFRIGPLEAERSDAFGLWSRVTTIAPDIDLTVYPAVEKLVPPAHSRGDDPTTGSPQPAAVGPNGEDLYGLRPYRMGDDLRRVHWPSTARTGDLVVRQLELPRQGRATVLLDVRASVHTPETLEAAVSAAASIVSASWAAGALVRLATTDGTDSGIAAGHPHFEALLEHLAVVARGRMEGLEAVVAGLHRAGNGGALAVVTAGDTPTADIERVAGLRSRFNSLTIVVVAATPGLPAQEARQGPPAQEARQGPPAQEARQGPPAQEARQGRPGDATAATGQGRGTKVVPVPAGSPLAPAWDAAATAGRAGGSW
ncbi:MAG: DUF58 domain-containing protein [Acidimicrobiales bacterium]